MRRLQVSGQPTRSIDTGFVEPALNDLDRKRAEQAREIVYPKAPARDWTEDGFTQSAHGLHRVRGSETDEAILGQVACGVIITHQRTNRQLQGPARLDSGQVVDESNPRYRPPSHDAGSELKDRAENFLQALLMPEPIRTVRLTRRVQPAKEEMNGCMGRTVVAILCGLDESLQGLEKFFASQQSPADTVLQTAKIVR
jgi:hypothetical protein